MFDRCFVDGVHVNVGVGRIERASAKALANAKATFITIIVVAPGHLFPQFVDRVAQNSDFVGQVHRHDRIKVLSHFIVSTGHRQANSARYS